jgi:hypothetical protein
MDTMTAQSCYGHPFESVSARDQNAGLLANYRASQKPGVSLGHDLSCQTYTCAAFLPQALEK